jgi:hypothetical protein
VPDTVSRRPPVQALVWSLLGALVGLWLGYALVAGMTKGTSSPPPAAEAATLPRGTPVDLALGAPPALGVRPALLAHAPLAITKPKPKRKPKHRRRHKPARRHVAPPTTAAMSAPASTQVQTPISNPTTPAATPAPTTPVQPTPAPRPARKPQTSLVAKPKPSSGPDFDDSTPSGFDNSG